ncbi:MULTISPECIES: hypothetical protein [Paraburkholderia]|jgi:hypothetical protein|uniref:Uncharacterized protein n=1 Tax=Paraburkholderia tropica TaxID=92647 RepID=A0A1A5X8H3_9BURK|nr:hypothetical protein [Paraburkholderia tropica]MBB2978610.1 hypothetical protein [Paraburkholderia tropica]MBB2998803.1 hypothetical protein [Paraburkholderia tropica]MBB6318421.1 hypothetical protein [Paraburkholderia tropica]MDE1139342.1 hypothetical protein [Paraburkholderia tropica]OBR49732.1 hypothetical protein A6456_28130 [Paraburkholderia tropica]
MTIHRVYVRGHGGLDKGPLPPAADAPIDIVTVGEFGCTMSGQVADAYIYGHVTRAGIANDIESARIIYWTFEQSDAYDGSGDLDLPKPPLNVTPEESATHNLVLQGDGGLGECGVCYWSAASSELRWLVELGDGDEITLAQILDLLRNLPLAPDDAIELYWTACMSAKYWRGSRKRVSFKPQ